MAQLNQEHHHTQKKLLILIFFPLKLETNVKASSSGKVVLIIHYFNLNRSICIIHVYKKNALFDNCFNFIIKKNAHSPLKIIFIGVLTYYNEKLLYIFYKYYKLDSSSDDDKTQEVQTQRTMILNSVENINCFKNEINYVS